MLTFYINRAGRNLPSERKHTLEAAKGRLRELFGPTSTKWQPVQAQTATVSGLWQARIVRLTAAGLST
jgi:hypothetical protein